MFRQLPGQITKIGQNTTILGVSTVKKMIFSQFYESQSFWNHQKWILREKLG